MELAAFIESSFGMRLEFGAFFEALTVSSICSKLGDARGSGIETPLRQLLREEEDQHEHAAAGHDKTALSYGQRALWFVQQLDRADTTYNIACAARIAGSLQVSRLSSAFQKILSKYEILRARFEAVDGIPVWRTREDAMEALR